MLCPEKARRAAAGEVGIRERWSPGLLVGTAFHAGMAALLTLRAEDEGGAEDIVTRIIRDGWPPETPDQEVAEARTVACLRRVWRDTMPGLLHDSGTVRAVEQPLEDEGIYVGTPDVVTEHGEPGNRYLVVTDWKTHWTLGDPYVEREQVETEESWQLHQYAYFAQEQYTVPVRYIRKVTIRISPSPHAWVYTVEVTPARLTRWRKQADAVWRAMDSAQPWQNWGACRRYGRCEFYRECHHKEETT
jgi:hypothetical protein